MKKFIAVRSSYLFAVAIAIGLVILGIEIFKRQLPSHSVPPQFDLSEFTLPNFPVGEKKSLALGIHNTNSFPIRIVGIGGSCGPGGCVEATAFQALLMQPGEKKAVTIEFKAPMKPGPIEAMLVVYYSSMSLRSKDLFVKGNSVDQESRMK